MSFFTRPILSDRQVKQPTGSLLTMAGETNFSGILKSKGTEISADTTGALSGYTLSWDGNKIILLDPTSLVVDDFDSRYVRFDINNQGLTTTERQNARTNIQAIAKDIPDIKDGLLTLNDDLVVNNFISVNTTAKTSQITATGLGIGGSLELFLDSTIGGSDTLGVVRFGGTDSELSSTTTATVQANSDGGIWSGTSKGTELRFYNTPSGAISPILRTTIKSDGTFDHDGNLDVSGTALINGTTTIESNTIINGLINATSSASSNSSGHDFGNSGVLGLRIGRWNKGTNPTGQGTVQIHHASYVLSTMRFIADSDGNNQTIILNPTTGIVTHSDAQNTNESATLGQVTAVSDASVQKSGDTMTGNLLMSAPAGIDSIESGTGDTLNIGTANADVINIGWSGTVVNINGTKNWNNVTDLEVTDKLVRYNVGGGLASATSSGFELEEDGVVTGYFKTNGTRDGWLLKAPANFEIEFDTNGLTASRSQNFQDLDGTFALVGVGATDNRYELVSNKVTDFNIINNTLYPTTQAVSENFATTGHNLTHILGGSDQIDGEELKVEVIPPTSNYTPTESTLRGQFQGVDSALGSLKTTTAGLLARVFFTAEEHVVSGETFFRSQLGDAGIVASDSPTTLTLTQADGETFFDQDLLSDPFAEDLFVPAGAFSGTLTVRVDSGGHQQRYRLEIYLADGTTGEAVDSGISGAPVGDLGQPVIAEFDTGVIELSNGTLTNSSFDGILLGSINIPTGARVRTHVSAEKLTSGGGSMMFEVFYGSDHRSQYDIPVAPTTDTVINRSSVTGQTSGEALDFLNNNKEDVSNKATNFTTLNQILYPTTAAVFNKFVTQDTQQTITATKTFDPSGDNLKLGGDGTANDTTLRNTSADSFGSSGINRFGFNQSNNIYFSKDADNESILAFNNTALRTYTLPDASGTVAFTSDITSAVNGTTNTLAKFGSANTVVDSQIFDNGTSVGIGISSGIQASLHIVEAGLSGAGMPNNGADGLIIENSATTGLTIKTPNTNSGNIAFQDPENNIAGLIQYNHSTNAFRFLNNAVETWSILSSGILQSNGAQTIQSSGTEALTLQWNGGNVGVGTSIVPERISIAGSGTQRIRITETVSEKFAQIGQTSTNTFVVAAGDDNFITFSTTTTGTVEKARILSNGNFLIGTTTDTGEKLQVNGTTKIDDGDGSLLAYGGGLRMFRQTSYIRPDENGTQNLNIGGPTPGSTDWNDINFRVTSEFEVNDNTIWHAGNVAEPQSGDGTANTLVKYTGTGTIGNSRISDDGTVVRIEHSGDNFTALQTGENATPASSTGIYLRSTTEGRISVGGDGAFLSFYTGGPTTGSERWRITSSGILQSNGAQTIQTSGTEALTMQGNGGNVGFGTNPVNNRYEFSTGNWATQNESATRIFGSTSFIADGFWTGPLSLVWTQNSNDGSIRMLNLALTDAGTGNQPNYGLYVEGEDLNYISGKVLIGTTTDTGEKLQVNGSVRINLGGSSGGIHLRSEGWLNLYNTDNTQRRRLNVNPSSGFIDVWDQTAGQYSGIALSRIKFPSTQVPSSDPNTLDDYEEGTFTPEIQGSTGNPTVTYTTQIGNYTKIGNSVIFNIRVDWSSLSGGSGDLRVNLPFGPSNPTNTGVASLGLTDGITYSSGYTNLSGFFGSLNQYVIIREHGSNVSSMSIQISALSSSGGFTISGIIKT